MSDQHGNYTYSVLDLDDPDCPQYDDFGFEIDELRPIKQQIEEIKTSMAEFQRRTEIQSSIIQEMRRRLSEAESHSELQEQKIRDLSEQLHTAGATGRASPTGDMSEIAPTPVTVTATPDRMEEDTHGSDSTSTSNLNAAILRRVLRLEERGKIQDDMDCKKSLLISNLGIENVDLMRENHYPKIKHYLRGRDLGFLLDDGAVKVSNVRLYKSGAIKIRYSEEWMAHYHFKKITDFIKEFKSDRRYWGDRTYEMAHRIKFQVCTPPRYSKERRVLADEGMRLKRSGTIKFFDFLVIKGKLIMKTFQRLDGYQFYEVNGTEVTKTSLSSLNHKRGRYYFNILNQNTGIPMRHFRVPDPELEDINGRPLMFYDTQAQREARQRHAATWRPTPEDPGMEIDNNPEDRAGAEE